jgi:ribose transport system permease protein
VTVPAVEVGQATAVPPSVRQRLAGLEQGTLVMGLTVVLVAVGALTTRRFFTTGNLRVVILLSAALGIVAVGEAIVILGKGVDLSIAVVAALSAQGAVELWQNHGYSETQAFLLIIGMALVMGFFNGWLVAYAEVPALFATLGTWQLFNGVLRRNLVQRQLYNLPPDDHGVFHWIGRGHVLGIQMPIVLAAAIFVGAALFISYTSWGRLIRSMGDNPEAARLMGAPVRPLQVSTYVISAVLAAVAGLVILGKDGGYSTVYGGGSDILFDAITIVVIGGVSLSGGRGSIFGVFAGAAFVAVIVNLLTLRNFGLIERNFTKGFILLIAVTADAWLHPRDEETAKTEDL